ncbi:MAG: LptA/OstA family protein, partial [Lacunisphaera sp.]
MLLARVTRFFSVSTLLFCLVAGFAHAQPLQPTITSDKSDYDIDTGELVFKGHARLVYGEILLTADEIRFNQKSSLTTANGHFVLTYGKRRMLAD